MAIMKINLSFKLVYVPTQATRYFKKIFWPLATGGIGGKFQILEMLEYISGLKYVSTSISMQNPFFEMACGLNK